MNNYGIGHALKAFLLLLRTTGRGTGRTTKMVAKMTQGDVAIVAHGKEGRYIETLAKDKFNKTVKTITVDPSKYHSQDLLLSNLKGTRQRVWFDHHWVELRFEHELNDMVNRISAFDDHVNMGAAMGPTVDEEDRDLGRYPPRSYAMMSGPYS